MLDIRPLIESGAVTAVAGIVRENVWSKAKNVKGHVCLDFQKNVKKNVKNVTVITFLGLNSTLKQICCPLRNY